MTLLSVWEVEVPLRQTSSSEHWCGRSPLEPSHKFVRDHRHPGHGSYGCPAVCTEGVHPALVIALRMGLFPLASGSMTCCSPLEETLARWSEVEREQERVLGRQAKWRSEEMGVGEKKTAHFTSNFSLFLLHLLLSHSPLPLCRGCLLSPGLSAY